MIALRAALRDGLKGVYIVNPAHYCFLLTTIDENKWTATRAVRSG
jgi:hypothetical protein